MACSVPVFRYALERWEAEPYAIVVFHRGPLTAGQETMMKMLTQAANSTDRPINLQVVPADLSQNLPPWLGKLYEQVKPPLLPWTALVCPGSAAAADDPEQPIPPVAMSGPLQPKLVSELVDSPARRELVARLLKGESAVWLLLTCGDKSQDDAAAKLLTARLKKMESALALPADGQGNPETTAQAAPGEPDDQAMGESPGINVSPGVPLKIAFSVLTVDRNSPAERVLLSILTCRDKRLAQAKSPIAIPVFGRGRALDAMLGEAFTADNIEQGCAFLCGDCSCQVKEMQPGSDLLVAADWEASLTQKLAVDKPLPPLTGVLPTAAEMGQSQTPPAVLSESSASWTWLLAAAGVVVLGLTGIVLVKRFRQVKGRP